MPIFICKDCNFEARDKWSLERHLNRKYGCSSIFIGSKEKDENGKLKGYGNYVRLKHEDGKFSEYGHLNDLSVFGNVNDKSETKPSAAKGDVIGYVGDTGDSTNPHLHYTRKDKNRKSFPPPQEGLDDLLDSLNGECK